MSSSTIFDAGWRNYLEVTHQLPPRTSRRARKMAKATTNRLPGNFLSSVPCNVPSRILYFRLGHMALVVVVVVWSTLRMRHALICFVACSAKLAATLVTYPYIM